MAEIASVISVSPVPGTTMLSVGVAVLKGIDSAARNTSADFGLLVTITYNSVNNTIVPVSSGRISLGSTNLVGAIDNRTDAVQFNLSYGTNPAPGSSPNFSGTAQIVNKDPSGADIELGPAESTQL